MRIGPFRRNRSRPKDARCTTLLNTSNSHAGRPARGPTRSSQREHHGRAGPGFSGCWATRPSGEPHHRRNTRDSQRVGTPPRRLHPRFSSPFGANPPSTERAHTPRPNEPTRWGSAHPPAGPHRTNHSTNPAATSRRLSRGARHVHSANCASQPPQPQYTSRIRAARMHMAPTIPSGCSLARPQRHQCTGAWLPRRPPAGGSIS